MRTIALVVLSIGLSASALAGPIDDQFAAGVGGIPWGMKLHDLVAMRPGGDHASSTAPGERTYALLDDEPLFDVPQPGTRIQYHFGKRRRSRVGQHQMVKNTKGANNCSANCWRCKSVR